MFRELGHQSSLLEWDTPEGWLLTRRFRVVRRGLAIIAWTVPAVLLQALLIMFPGRPKVAFARFYWMLFSRFLGVHVRVIGDVTGGSPGRPVVFVSNHCSWIDIPILGGVLDGCFVAKGEIARWPVVSAIARLGRSVFVTRQRGSTRQELDTMRGRLSQGDSLVLFPEGTSSDGSRVLPFRSTFFAVADQQEGLAPIIQPVSIVYDRLGGLPAGRASRPVFAWYGDMDIASHFWRLAQHTGLRATVLLHAPVDPARFTDRKALAQAVWQTVADGAAALRQNRPARPLAVVDAPEPDLSGGEPAFA